jgi:hypothetical protein
MERNMKIRVIRALVVASGLFLGSGAAYAALLDVGAELGTPNTTFFSGNQTSQFTGGTLSIRATLSQTDGVDHPQPSSLSIDIVLNSSDGSLVGGVSGDDFKIQDATGVLLTGEILAFGFLDTGSNADFFDFRFHLTGGSLASQYAGKDIGVTVTLENSNFTGFPTNGFSGLAKGNVGPIRPICAGEIGDYVWFDKNADGIQNSNEPGIDGVTVLLKDSTGTTVIATTITGCNGPCNADPNIGHGFYHFLVCPDTYKVEVPSGQAVLSGKIPTTVTAGLDRAIDSNPNPSTVTLTTSIPSDLTIDFGYKLGVEECPTDGTGSGPGSAGTFACDGDGITTDVHCVYSQNTLLNDNSYGSTAVGWGEAFGGLPGSHQGHTFSNLTGSDRAEFVVKAGDGTVVADFTMDYISLGKSLIRPAQPSGYDSLGPFGGDHACVVGCTTSVIKDWNTSLAHNLNDHGFCTAGNCSGGGTNLLVNSPPTVSNSDYTLPGGSPYVGWDFVNRYEFTIAASAFNGHGGFGGITGPNAISIPFIHNSPAKNGPNIVTPGPCPPEGGGECKITAAAVTFGSKQVKVKLTNTGTSTITLSEISLTFPQGTNGNLTKVKLGGNTLFSGLRTSPTTFTSANLGSNVANKSITAGTTRELLFEFAKTPSKNLGDYSGLIKFGDGQGCSVEFPPSGQPGCPATGQFIMDFDANGNLVVRYEQPLSLNDNSYGTNAIGWGSKGHTFSNLTGSDKAEFFVKDANGNVVLHFFLDYISQGTKTPGSPTPSGYDSLGPFGGDGDFVSGNSQFLLSWNTSMAKNLNETGFCTGTPPNCTVSGVNLLVNSPPAAAYPEPDPPFGAWDFTDAYEFTVSKFAFPNNTAVKNVSVGLIHNSPAKVCP